MTEINPIGLALPNNSASGTDLAAGQLADNFDTFLTLLTEQLQNQDPLNPMDSQQFVSQLVDFSSVEQLIGSNQSLQSLLELQSATARMSAVDYIGKQATVSTDKAALSGGQASWTYGLPREADRSQIVITNEQGRVVRTLDGETGAGPHDFTWDGRDDAGNLQPDGIYTLQVVANDANDNGMFVPVRVTGEVTGVDMSGEDVVVEMGALRVPADRVIALRNAAARAA